MLGFLKGDRPLCALLLQFQYMKAERRFNYFAYLSRFLQGEGNVFPNDVKQVAMDLMRHRVIVTYEAEAENLTSEDIIGKILDTVPVP